jgi:hypothetical protein
VFGLQTLWMLSAPCAFPKSSASAVTCDDRRRSNSSEKKSYLLAPGFGQWNTLISKINVMLIFLRICLGGEKEISPPQGAPEWLEELLNYHFSFGIR